MKHGHTKHKNYYFATEFHSKTDKTVKQIRAALHGRRQYLSEGFLRGVDDVEETVVILVFFVNVAQQHVVADERAVVDDQIQRLWRLQTQATSIYVTIGRIVSLHKQILGIFVYKGKGIVDMYSTPSYGSHSFYTANTPYLPLPRKRSPEIHINLMLHHRVSIAITRLCNSVRLCDSVCLSVRKIKPKRLKPKSPNLAQR